MPRTDDVDAYETSLRKPIKTRTRFRFSSFFTNNEIRFGIIEDVNFGTAEWIYKFKEDHLR